MSLEGFFFMVAHAHNEAPPVIAEVDYSSVVEAVLILGCGVLTVSVMVRSIRWLMSLL